MGEHTQAHAVHKVHPPALALQVKLLTPFQAENDHHIKDTYNYATVQVRRASRHRTAHQPLEISGRSRLPEWTRSACPSAASEGGPGIHPASHARRGAQREGLYCLPLHAACMTAAAQPHSSYQWH